MKNTIKPSKPLFIIAIITFLIVGSLSLAFLFLWPSNARDNRDPDKQQEMMATILAWGRLAPFPATATKVLIRTEGNLFARSFRAGFVAPKQDIQAWINDSPRLSEATPEKLSSGAIRYSIVPGEDASKAEVTIDYLLNKVEIYVSWS